MGASVENEWVKTQDLSLSLSLSRLVVPVLVSLYSLLMVATWLILPVVIRSSQRLSHACLSINLLLWNCERLIISVIIYLIVPYYLDNRSNSRANTCVNTFGWYLLERNQLLRDDVVNHNKFANRTASCWRWIIQVSALSALDGRVLAYHGFNG